MEKDRLFNFTMLLFLLIVLALTLASVALSKQNTSIGVGLTPEQVTLLENISNNTYFTSQGCLAAKCFTDDFVAPNQLIDNNIESNIFFATFAGTVTCASLTTQEIKVGDTVSLTPLTLNLNGLVLSSSGIVSPNLFQMETAVAISNTFQVGDFTTTERLSLTPENGTIVYDSTLGILSIYQSNAWFLISNASGILSISSSTLTITGTNMDPIIDLTPTGIVANTYDMPTIQFNEYGIALSATENTLTGTTNQIDVTSFPNPVISLSDAFLTNVNGKVNKSGDTMLGALDSTFVGSSTTPNFAINSTNGMFQSNTNYLSFSTNGSNRLEIDNSGNVYLTSLSTGVVKTDINGKLENGLILNSELSTQTSLNNANYIVTRDASRNFAANMITLSGTTTNSTDVATKNYVDTTVNTAITLGLSVKQPVIAVSVVPITSPPSGLLTIDTSVLLVDGDRVLLVAQVNQIYNGAWIAHIGLWTRPTDFDNGDTAGTAYFLVQMGTDYAGSSWVCSSPSSVIGTDPLTFSQFSSPQSATGVNDDSVDAVIYKNSLGSTLHFYSLLNDTNGYLTMTNTTNSVQFAINATSDNTSNTLVARDGSGDFLANSINLNTGLIVPTGSFGSPSIRVGPVATGISSSAGNLQLSTAFGIGLSIASATGIVTLPSLTSVGIVHNSSSGVLSTSLIVNADVSASAGIVDTKLATISTSGKVSNSATTATSANTANAIVSRGSSGQFSAGVITSATTVEAKAFDAISGGFSLTFGGTVATAISIGRSGVITTIQNILYVSTIDRIGSVTIGPTSATSLSLGNSGITTTILGTCNVATIDTSAALTIGGTSATSLSLGRSGIITTILGTCAIPTLTIGISPNAYNMPTSITNVSANTNAVLLYDGSGNVVFRQPINGTATLQSGQYVLLIENTWYGLNSGIFVWSGSPNVIITGSIGIKNNTSLDRTFQIICSISCQTNSNNTYDFGIKNNGVNTGPFMSADLQITQGLQTITFSQTITVVAGANFQVITRHRNAGSSTLAVDYITLSILP